MTDAAGDDDDTALAKAAAQGDERAFTRLVRRHKEPVYRLLRRYLGAPDDAYDATQETFIAAWKAIGRYDAARPFGTWVRAIALNKARDRFRRLAVQRLIFSRESPESVQVAAPGGDPEQTTSERQTLVALDQAIAALPDKLKRPFLLMAFEGLSRRQTAESLGVSEKTVDTRVYRARRKLAERLNWSAD